MAERLNAAPPLPPTPCWKSGFRGYQESAHGTVPASMSLTHAEEEEMMEPFEFEIVIKEYDDKLFLVAEHGRIIGEAQDIRTVLTGASGHVIQEGQPVCVFEVVRVWQVYRRGASLPPCTARDAVERGWGDAVGQAGRVA